MKTPIPLLALVGGLVGTFVILSMTARWISALTSIVKDYRSGGAQADQQTPQPWALTVATLLHSGPWALAISGYFIHYLFTRPYASWWIWFFGGVCAGPLLLVAKYLVLRHRKSENEADPGLAAPLDLVARRKRMIWSTTAFWGGSMWALTAWQVWDSSLPAMFYIFVGAVCIAGGYVFALFMWEMVKSNLQAKDAERRRQR
jgi:hypothetical protein